MECGMQEINPSWIKKNCNRQNGIGADGVLILQNKNLPQVQMFNADGTDGQKCLNGVRCTAYYLVSQKNFPQKFILKMQQPIYCEVNENLVTINIGKVNYQKPHQIKIGEKLLQGHIVDVGNPHFVILEKIDLNWLKKYGKEIENHVSFPNRTNVEFVWGNKNKYNALIHERGCGITKACGTGAAAIMQTLYQQNKIKKSQKISIQMPGGTLKSYLNEDESIIQIAAASKIF
jgi:diaminopimelate epimerase